MSPQRGPFGGARLLPVPDHFVEPRHLFIERKDLVRARREALLGLAPPALSGPALSQQTFEGVRGGLGTVLEADVLAEMGSTELVLFVTKKFA